MDGLPVFVKEVMGEPGLLVEKQEGFEVGLLVGAFAHLELLEFELVGKVGGTLHADTQREMVTGSRVPLP